MERAFGFIASVLVAALVWLWVFSFLAHSLPISEHWDTEWYAFPLIASFLVGFMALMVLTMYFLAKIWEPK